MQKVAKLNLDDLCPAPSSFELSTVPGVKFNLGAFTLRVQLWLTKRFGVAGLEAAISGTDLEVISEAAYHVLDVAGKTRFPTLEKFQDAILSFKDRQNVASALLDTIGLSQPVLEVLSKQLEGGELGNASSPSLSTGEDATTALQTPTPGAVPSAS